MVSFEDAMKQARDWRNAAADNPDRIGTIYPSSAPISYEALDAIIAFIDETEPRGIEMPKWVVSQGNASAA